MEDKKIPHLTSNHLPVFILQALLAIVVVFSISYIVYLFLFGKNNFTVPGNPALQESLNEGGVATEAVISEGVDESMFVDITPENVDKEKFDGLFPAIQ